MTCTLSLVSLSEAFGSILSSSHRYNFLALLLLSRITIIGIVTQLIRLNQHVILGLHRRDTEISLTYSRWMRKVQSFARFRFHQVLFCKYLREFHVDKRPIPSKDSHQMLFALRWCTKYLPSQLKKQLADERGPQVSSDLRCRSK